MNDATRMYDALRRISRDYQTVDQLRKRAEKQYGLGYREALEMAYDNIQNEARLAIHGMRRPKAATQPKPEEAPRG